ncbi:hypothetical protein [Salinispora arenicola]|uniref:hypothetical protein n=1 Tax=Salinispora arenicola TaxID=168697 RepID=UPI0003647C8D|nr:hypothetical protein [Salinispora arenicola]
MDCWPATGVLTGLVPVGAVLLIAQDAEREERLRADLLRGSLRNAVATTTRLPYALETHVRDTPADALTSGAAFLHSAVPRGVVRSGCCW